MSSYNFQLTLETLEVIKDVTNYVPFFKVDNKFLMPISCITSN